MKSARDRSPTPDGKRRFLEALRDSDSRLPRNEGEADSRMKILAEQGRIGECGDARVIADFDFSRREFRVCVAAKTLVNASGAWSSRRLGSGRLCMGSECRHGPAASAQRPARFARSSALREKHCRDDTRPSENDVPLRDSRPARHDRAPRWRRGDPRVAPLRIRRLVAVEDHLSGEAPDMAEEAARRAAMDPGVRLPTRLHATGHTSRRRASNSASGVCPSAPCNPTTRRIRLNLCTTVRVVSGGI